MTDRGAVYSFGHGMHGQLGHGDTSDQPTPRLIDGLPERGRVVAVAAGAHHSLAVSDRGAIYSFGHGGHGQLGHGDRADQLLPQLVGGARVMMAALNLFVDKAVPELLLLDCAAEPAPRG